MPSRRTDSPSMETDILFDWRIIMEFKNITVLNFNRVIKTFSSIGEALNFAVSESRKACFAGNDMEASRKITFSIGDKGYGFSMLNFSHYSDESLDEQAAWFEIAIKKDGSVLRNNQGDIESSIFQIRYNKLKSFFKALETAPKVSLKGVWVNLALLDREEGYTKEAALADYMELYHNSI